MQIQSRMSINKRVAGIVALILVVLGGGATYYFVNADSSIAGTKVSVAKGSGKLYHGENRNDKYTYRYNATYTAGVDNMGQSGKTYEALCAEASKDTPDGTNSKVYDLSLDISTTKYEQIKRILLTTYVGRNYKLADGTVAYKEDGSVFDWNLFSNYTTATSFKNRSIALGHVLVSYVYSGGAGGTGFSSSFASRYWDGSDGLIQQIYDIFENEPYKSLAESVVVRRTEGATGSKTNQDLVWLEGISVEPEIPEGEFGVKKRSSNPDLTDGSSYYTLKDAVFDVYKASQCTGDTMETDSEDGNVILDGECSGDPVATITTGTDGATGTVMLPVGIYYVKERSQPRGFRLNVDYYETAVIDGETEWLNIVDDPIVGGVKIKKVDSETLAISPQGGASLVGTKYRIDNMSTSTTVTENLTIGSDGYAEYEGLAPGRYKISEVSAGTGYGVSSATRSFTIADTISEDGDNIVDLTGNPFTDDVYRGNVKFTKLAEDYACKTGLTAGCDTLGGVPFVIENTDTGEKHVIVANADGVVDTSAVSHTTNVNANDGLINNSYGAIVESGLWFGEISAKSDAKGALPYGNYKITELRTSANEPWKLLEGDTAITFKIESDSTTAVDLGTFTDALIDSPALGTTATNESGEKKINVGEKVKIKDRISYSGLSAGKEYSVVVELVDKANSSSNSNYRTVGIYNSENELASSIEVSGLIAGSGGSGTWDVELAFDSADYVGQELVVFEELWRGDVWIGEHKSLTDGDQTVTVKKPEVLSTVATTNVADANAKTIGAGKVRVYDIVTLKGLVKSKSYTVKTTAKLEDGTAIKLLNGTNKVDSISNTFSYTNTSGAEFAYPIELYLDTAQYGGKKIVLYQQLIGDEDYGTFPNSNSSSSEIAAETLSVNNPAIGTVAFDGETGSEGDKEIKIGASAKIRDKVHYENLVSGTKYYLTGKVVDASGNVIAHTEDNTLVEKEAAGSSGDWYLDFTVDTRRYNGQDLTVYEYLYADSAGSIEMVEHAKTTLDGNAGEKAAQTVSVARVSISTSAWVGSAGVKEAGVGKVTVSDTISYVGLTNGDSYKLSGELVLVEGGVEKEVVSSKTETFTASVDSEARGSYTVNFENINTSKYIGKTLVVKEVLYPNKSTVTEADILASHTELDNDEQTIRVKTPTIETVATSDGASGKEVDVRKDLTIYEKVRITGLVKGESYTVVGTLWNAAEDRLVSASAFRKSGTNEAASPITVTNDDGSFEGMFEFVTDTRSLIGKEITVQEVILYTFEGTEREVVRHTDKTTEQTVRVKTPAIGTVASDGISNVEGDKEVGVGETVIKDKVSYNNLRVGQAYKLVAKMIDKETNLEVGCNGVKEFTPEASDGEVEVLISCNTGTLGGKRLVAFEKLYIVDGEEEVEIGKHEDLGDADQFIDVSSPAIGTIATAETKAYEDEKIVDILEEAKIKDKVRYSGLVIGSKYRVEGVLYDKATGEKLLDSENQEVTAEYTWTADKESDEGGVEIVFELDTTDLPGRKLVAFEKLYLVVGEGEDEEEIEIAAHEKIDDEDQSVEVKPRVGTKVVDKIDNDQAVGVGKVEVVDTVSYEGLKVGKKYLLRGVMMDKATGEPLKQTVDGEEMAVEGYTEFTVGEEGYEETDGEVKVEFSFETDKIQGKELVVFETLYEIETVVEEGVETEDRIIRTEHEDLEDEAQLVIVKTVGLGTTATDADDDDKELAYGEEVEVNDLVEYRGLVKGEKYKLVGNLVDKENPEVSVAYAEAEFIAEGENGEYIISFSLNTNDMSGRELVAFERLYYINEAGKEVEIGKHEDLEDQKQTVWVKVFTPNTGIFGAISDGGAVAKVSVVAVAIGALGAVYAVIERKRKFRF